MYQQPQQPMCEQPQPIQSEYHKPLQCIDGIKPSQIYDMVQEACINYQNNDNDVEAKLHLLKIMYLTAEIAAEIKIYSEVCAKNKETVDDDYWLWKENISKSTAKWVSDCVLEIIDNNPDIIDQDDCNEISAFLIMSRNEQKIKQQMTC